MAISHKNTLDNLLDYAQRNQVATVPAKSAELEGCHFHCHANAVVLGRFAMQVHCHDTGNNVRVYIIGAGKPYCIIDGTYWKRSGYDHNPFKHEHGAWDTAFDEAQRQLFDLVESHKSIRIAESESASAKKESEANSRKTEVESLFK